LLSPSILVPCLNHQGSKIWSKAQLDIDRIVVIWRECLQTYKGPYLFGDTLTIAETMFAPDVTRFHTYGIVLDPVCQAYCDRIMALPEMQEWIAQAKLEPEDIEELVVEF
jgi:glutathione S-transferase